MLLRFAIQPNEKLALKDPSVTDLGRRIVQTGLFLMADIGYEHFTFKKLAAALDTAEASIYRYFENKHRLLLYFLTCYWNLMEHSLVITLQSPGEPRGKIRRVIEMLVNGLPDWADAAGMDKSALQRLVIAESSKVYLIKEVDDINQDRLFKPYKDLCGRISELFVEARPDFAHARSLASTTVEMAQFQVFFQQHLPALTDSNGEKSLDRVRKFLEAMVFSMLDHPQTEL